jgi:hypothetical protein
LDETAPLPWHQRTAAVAAIYADQSRAPELARHWTDARQILLSFQHHHAVVRCTLVAVAAERHRLVQGDWPATLEALVPTFLSQLPSDPFDGRPLRYKRLSDGIMIYSVGVDATDDGGQLLWVPVQQQPTDVGVRLWDVNHRREAPPPAEENQP